MKPSSGKVALKRFLDRALLVVVQFHLLHNPASFLNLLHQLIQLILFLNEQTQQSPWITRQ